MGLYQLFRLISGAVESNGHGGLFEVRFGFVLSVLRGGGRENFAYFKGVE
jgi:hypothetical protein